MKIAVFKPCSEISGNIILGALLDNGLDADALTKGLRVLPLSGWSINGQKVNRGGLQGTHVNIDNGTAGYARSAADSELSW